MSSARRYKKTKIGEIPEDWEIASFTKVADFVNGYGFKTSDWRTEGLPIVRIQNLNDPNAEFNYFDGTIDKKYYLENGDLLLSWSASLGVYIWNRGKAVLNQHIFKVIPKSGINKDYLYYVSYKAIEDLKRRIHGSTMRHFKKRELDVTSIPLPPLVEQRKIARILSCVDVAIRKTDEVIAKIERLKKGLMQQLLTRGIGHKKFKYSKDLGFEIPEEWAVVKYRNANERIFVGIASSSTKYFCKEGIPLIRNQNIKEKGLDLSDVVFITRGFSEANKSKMLRENDIVTVRTGYPGLSCKVTKEMEGWHTFTTLISRPNLAEFDPDYLVYILNSPVCKAQISRLQAGMAQQNLNVGQMVNLMILKPPKSEQKTIAERLKIIDRLLRVEEAYLGKLRLIKQGLMHNLLSGRIRVKVD